MIANSHFHTLSYPSENKGLNTFPLGVHDASNMKEFDPLNNVYLTIPAPSTNEYYKLLVNPVLEMY